jgi:hypothetical protein
LNLTSNKVTWGGDVTSQRAGGASIRTLKMEDTKLFGYCSHSNPMVNVDPKEILIIDTNLSILGVSTNQINVILSPGCATPVTDGPYSLEFEASIVSISQAKILENLFIDIELVVTA